MTAATETTTVRERYSLKAAPDAFDRENKIIRGVKLAELGPFGSKGRGQFTQKSFDLIKQHFLSHLPKGLRCRLTHPNMSDDGITKTLGRMRNLRQSGDAIVADLHFLDLAFKPPVDGGQTSYGDFIFDLAREDSDLLETSFVLSVEKKYVLNEDGSRKLDENEEPLPPIWLPTELYASDVVGDGDAVHTGFLSARNHSLAAAQASEVLDKIFAGRTREEIDERATGFVKRYLDNKFGEHAEGEPEVSKDQAPAAGLSDADKNWIMESLGTVVDSKVKPIADQVASLTAGAEDSARAEQITALCKQAGCPDKASEFIADKNLSAEAVRKELWAEVLKKRQLPDHPGENPQGDGSGTGGRNLSDADKAREELGKEYDATPDIFKSMGISRDDYLQAGLIEKGLVAKKAEVRDRLEKSNPLAIDLLG